MSAPWARFNEDGDFKALFESEQSPIKAEIDRLERRIRGLNVTDPIESMKDRATLHGIRLVQEAVRAAAHAEAEASETTLTTTKRRWAMPVDLTNRPLPRRVAG